MKTIILYESKHGCTKKCATYIKEKNHFENMVKISEFKDDLSMYDKIVIGTPVYVGQINKVVKAFVETNKEVLLTKEVHVFICAMNLDNYEQMLSMNFDESIRKHAKITHVGGAYDFKKLGWFSKLIVKKIAKIDHSVEDIKYDQLDLIF